MAYHEPILSLPILKKSGALLSSNVADDGYKLIPIVGGGGRLVDHVYFFLVSDEDDGGDLVGGKALFKIAFRPEDPLGIDHGGGL
jgi:hypothetical protein